MYGDENPTTVYNSQSIYHNYQKQQNNLLKTSKYNNDGSTWSVNQVFETFFKYDTKDKKISFEQNFYQNYKRRAEHLYLGLTYDECFSDKVLYSIFHF